MPCHVSPYLQDILPTAKQHTFCSMLYGEDPVSDLSLHMLWAPRSALWVVGCGSSVTPVPPTRAWAPALDIMEYGLAKATSLVTYYLLGCNLYHV